MYVFEELAESRIREAMERGDLNDLPGAGKPLSLEEDGFIPEEMRMAYKILKNAGYIPPEIELRRDINATQSALAAEFDNEPSRRRNLKKLQCLFLRLDETRRRQTNMLLQQEYYQRILNRL
jgi:hypothetical protein